MTLPAPSLTWEQAVSWLREQPGQEALVRACFFDDPLVDAAARYYHSEEWQATRCLFGRDGGQALDVGAGRGISTYALARDGWQVTALEPDPGDLVGAGAIRQLTRATGLSVQVVETWGEALPFPDAVFDLVLCRQVLHHARDLPALCREVARVLKPGGRMVATREHVISRPGDLAAFLASHPLHGLYGGENAYLLGSYQEAIRGAGLKLLACLNPLQSVINLYPMTLEDHRRIIARRLRLPLFLIGDFLMGWIGARLHAPGRLYTFVAARP